MSEKRFYSSDDVDGYFIYDNKCNVLSRKRVVALLNSLTDENKQLRQQLKEKQEEERLYANEIVKLNKEVKDNQFLRLGNDY